MSSTESMPSAGFPGMAYCRGCGSKIHESAVTCPHCGYTQPSNEVERCWQCGNQVQTSARLCPHCGYTGTLANEANSAVLWAYIGAIVLPIIGIGLGIYLLTKQRFGHGIVVIVLSFFMADFWWGFWRGVWLHALVLGFK